mgnify:CR=1 FL=1
MKDSQLVQNAQNKYLYGSFLDVSEAFNKGLLQASKGNPLQTTNPVGVVKNNYEEQLEGYLNKLPDDVDLAGVPDKYRNGIANYLSVQKSKYANLANNVNEYEVGSEMYMDMNNQMNNIRKSFENLDTQMKVYGNNKKNIISDIQTQSTSLSGENQANVNLLRSVYTEEFDMAIDDYGNIAFSGDDGMVALNDLPGYELKDYKAAEAFMKAGSTVYENGVKLDKGGIMYNQYRSSVKSNVDQGGRNTLMSLVYDGLVGNTALIDDPFISQSVDAYNTGNMTFEALRDVVVDNYMDVLVETSNSGYKAKQRAVSRRKLNNTSPNPNSSSTPRFIMSKMRFPGAIGNPPINGIEYTMVYDTEGNAYYKNPLKPGDGWISEKDVVNIKIASTPGNKTSPNVGANSKNAKSSGGNKIVLPVTGLKK